jgi:putative ABC transport system ATP-binding protein
VMQLFHRLHEEGTTIVQVTHSREVAAWSERVVTLRDGWIVDEPAGRATSPAIVTSHS